MKGFSELLLLVLVLPILCSKGKRGTIFNRIKKSEKSRHLNGINVKEVGIAVLPESSYHIGGGNYNYYAIFVTDESIYLVKRSKDYYHKMVFTYEKQTKNDVIALSKIEIDEDNSKFLFNSDETKDGCNAENGKEYSYKELKGSCNDGMIKVTIDEVKKATQISCEKNGIYTECIIDIGSSSNSVEINERQSLEEINLKLSNMKATYSPSTNFHFNYTSERNYYGSIRENKMMSVEYIDYYFSFTTQNVNVKDEGSYTKIDNYYYLCLERDCKYICVTSSYEDDWDIYESPCYRKETNFKTHFNDIYIKVYNNAKNFDVNESKLRRSLLEENDIDKKETASKGYYYEDVSSYNNYYKGYFVIDNTLTIIEQAGLSQSNVKQLKLVLKLDEKKSIKLENLDDINIDEEKSGVEPIYSSDESCKSFIQLKDLTDGKCSVSIDYLNEEWSNREYNVTISPSEAKLIIHEIDEDNENDEIITLKEYDSAKLDKVITKITKYTIPIPDNKCLKYIIKETNYEYISSLYNKVFYYNEIDESEDSNTINFGYGLQKDDCCNTYDYYNNYDDSFSYASIDDSQYIVGKNRVFYHKFVDFKGNEYVECNEKLKNDALKEFENKINEIKEEEEINDGSVEYIVNIFFISLLFILFL